MKLHLLATIFLLLPALVLAQFETNGKYKIKSVEWQSVTANDTLAGRAEFSAEGKMLRCVSDSHGQSVKVFSYDNLQNLSRTITTFDGGRTDTVSFSYEYDGKRPTKRVQVSSVNGKKTVVIVEYVYDTLENKVREFFYLDGKLQKKTITTYDNAQLVVKKVFYRTANSRGVVGAATSCGQMAVVQSVFYVYGNDLQLLQTIVYDYDEEGLANRTINIFGKNGILTKSTVYDPDDYPSSEVQLKYDKKGSVVQKKIKYYADDSVDQYVEKYVYEYDDKGNWTARTTVVDDVPPTTTQRKILYY